DRTRPRLEARIGKHFVRIDGEGRRQGGQQQDQGGRERSHSAAPIASAGLLRRDGAPTRSLRSESETAPPAIITSAPPQMQRIHGFHQMRKTSLPSGVLSPIET